MNKVFMIGNTTKDVVLKYLNTGVAVGTTSLAINRYYKDRDGNKAQDTCFIDIKLFGKSAEIAKQYLLKGYKCLVEGHLHLEQYQNMQGQKVSKHIIIVTSLQLLDNKDKQQAQMQQDSYEDSQSYPI